MGIDLSSLLQGLSTATGGIARGLGERQTTQRELERQARLDLMAQRLQEAQLGNYQSEIQRRQAQTQAEQAKANKPPAAKPAPRIDPLSPQGIAAAAQRAAAVGAVRPVRASAPKPRVVPAVVEQKLGMLDQLEAVDQQLTDMETSAARAGKAISDPPWVTTLVPGASKTPIVGGLLGAGASRIGQSQMDPEHARYQALKQQWASLMMQVQPTAGRAGGAAMQSLLQNQYVPPPGTKVAAYSTFQNARHRFVRDTRRGLQGSGRAPAGSPPSIPDDDLSIFRTPRP